MTPKQHIINTFQYQQRLAFKIEIQVDSKYPSYCFIPHCMCTKPDVCPLGNSPPQILACCKTLCSIVQIAHSISLSLLQRNQSSFQGMSRCNSVLISLETTKISFQLWESSTQPVPRSPRNPKIHSPQGASRTEQGVHPQS